MKRIIILSLVLIFMLTGCAGLFEDDENDNSIIEESTTREFGIVADEADDEEFIGSWLTYLELQVTKDRQNEDVYRRYIEDIFVNLVSIGVNNVFIHARPFADALYESDINVSSVYAAPSQGQQMYFDCFGIAVETARKYNIKVHGWINPFRVSNTDNFDSLCESNVAKQWYKENNGSVCVVNGKIYFNPASVEVQKILLDTVSELMEKYNLDGIHIDDYFYPENCGNFDSNQYADYVNRGGQLSVEAFRRENINNLVSSIYGRVKSFGEEKIFSISPEAKVDKNYSEKYADVALWCKESGYADIIIPQIYYGFENENMPFESTLDRWKSLCENSEVKIVVGLALYKAGQRDEFAGESGKDEWINNSDIIKRQVESVRNKGCYGFSVYSSTYVNFNETFLSSQLNELKSVL